MGIGIRIRVCAGVDGIGVLNNFFVYRDIPEMVDDLARGVECNRRCDASCLASRFGSFDIVVYFTPFAGFYVVYLYAIDFFITVDRTGEGGDKQIAFAVGPIITGTRFFFIEIECSLSDFDCYFAIFAHQCF